MKFLNLLLSSLLFPLAVSAQSTPLFESGSTVCFLGNSITQSGEYQMVLQSLYATRFPERDVKFISCGIGGDTATQMIQRFEGDVMRYDPDYCFLMTGMNDMSASLYAAGLTVDEKLVKRRAECMDRYKRLTEELVKMMLKEGVKPILLTPTIYDETAQIAAPSSQGKCDALKQCSDYIISLAGRYGLPVVEFTNYMFGINQRAQRSDPSYTIIGADRVHPQMCGHFIMGHRIFTTLYPEARVVSSLSVDMRKKRVLEARNCAARVEADGSITLLSKALPLPVISEWQEAQRHISLSDINQEMLRVEGLKSGRYVLMIDGQSVDTLSSEQLGAGVSLATNCLTPQYQQAERVVALCAEYHERQAAIRAIANVEFKRLAAYKGACDAESIKRYLDAQNEKSVGKPWYRSGVNIVNEYCESKPREAAIVAQLDSIRELIHINKKISERKYTLRKL